MRSNKQRSTILALCLFQARTWAFQPSLSAGTPASSSSSMKRPHHAAAYYNDPSSAAASSAMSSSSTRRKPAITTTRMALAPVPLDGSVESSSSLLTAVDTFYQNSPYLAAFLTCSIKASTADMVAQTSSAQKDEETESTKQWGSTGNKDGKQIDIPRNLAFLTYGGIYQGLVQQLLYSSVYPALFGPGDTMTSVLSQVLMESAVVVPFFCMPLCYSLQSLFAADGDFSFDTVKKGLEKYYYDVTEQGLLFKYWMIWLPALSINFSVVPIHLRVVFVAMVSFFWVMVLSSVSSSEKTTAEQRSNDNRLERAQDYQYSHTVPQRLGVLQYAEVPGHVEA